ncbi:MAG: ABC transporter ATP-binding protein [Mollicutes bacterium]|nr:ABC transporter ATP-binding protein [Mollicutes bacterium]
MKEIKPLLKLTNVSKFYYNKGMVASGFTKVSLEFSLGEFVVITGESGSGKSTLLNVISGLDTYEEGEMYINGKETSHYTESDFEDYRKTYIGSIFQSFNLVSSYTVYQNIELVLLLNGYKKKDIKEKIIDLIKKVDLYKFKNTRVSRLSGGQKQRVAIARALAKDVPIIIADEPTGNLDLKSTSSVIKLLSEVAKDKLVIIVTHNYEQVAKYATRKIEMHDGRIREDILLKEYEKGISEIYRFKSLTFANKIRLGVRNAFNIAPKFFLMFLVFLFVIFAFLGQYSSFKKREIEISQSGENAFFPGTDVKRIVINKKNKEIITKDNIKELESLKYIKKVNEFDAVYDQYYNLESQDVYLYGTIDDIKSIKKVDKGRMPNKPNEIVVKGSKDDYYISSYEKLFAASLHLMDNSSKRIGSDEYKVVGIIYSHDFSYYSTFYVGKEFIEKAKIDTNVKYSLTKVKFPGGEERSTDGYSFSIKPSNKVTKGNAIIANEININCQYAWCKNKKININIENIYFKETIDVLVTGIFSKSNYTNYFSKDEYPYYDMVTGVILVSFEDYNYLYNKDIYQSSVIVDDEVHVDEVASRLDEMGYKTLKIKDALSSEFESTEILSALKIFRVIVTTILLFVLFFIAYFIIRLIQKSKNVYYSTVRILGGTKKNIASLIKIELFVVFNLTFMITMLFVLLVKLGILNSKTIISLTNYLKLNDYLLIYLILLIMSYLISLRYSRNLFKKSAMNTYREEV